jgi:hypothetical protein
LPEVPKKNLIQAYKKKSKSYTKGKYKYNTNMNKMGLSNLNSKLIKKIDKILINKILSELTKTDM